MSITGTPFDFLLLGLAVAAACGYGWLEGFHAGFRKGAGAAKGGAE